MDKRYKVFKEIPLKGGEVIPINTSVYQIHGNYYMDKGILPPDYQEDFDKLIKREELFGWNYLRPDNPVVGEMNI